MFSLDQGPLVANIALAISYPWPAAGIVVPIVPIVRACFKARTPAPALSLAKDIAAIR